VTRLSLQILLPLVVIALCALGGRSIINGRTTPERKERQKALTVVDIKVAKKIDYPMMVNTQGVVKPRIQSTLVPEISGKIIKASESFFAGNFFEEGDILLEIDPRDFEIAKAKAEAELVRVEHVYQQELVRTESFIASIKKASNALQQVSLTLKEEKARSQQALEDWKKLGIEGEAGELVLRQPQLQAAQAAMEAAKAELRIKEKDQTLTDSLLKSALANIKAAKADLRQKTINLQRCTVKAPFRGRIISKKAALGQYVNPGTALAQIYCINSSEVRLPVSNAQMAFLDLKQDNPSEKSALQARVDFHTTNISENSHWEGKIERIESEIDQQSRQHFVIARVDNPFDGKTAFKSGLFVKASIHGKTLKDVYILPVSAIRESNHLWVVNNESKLERRSVEVLWRNSKIAVLQGDINDSDKICTTALSYAEPGLPVKVRGSQAKKTLTETGKP